MKAGYLALVLVSMFSASGATWYVRPAVYTNLTGAKYQHPVAQAGIYGAQDGTSYANAWNGLHSIVWPSVGSNDTIYVCGSWIWNMTNSSWYAWQATAAVSNSYVNFRFDYPTDPATIFGGAVDHMNTYYWFGPDANGVYWTTNSVMGGAARQLFFEVTNGFPQQLNLHTNVTWVGDAGSCAFIGGTNFIKTIEGGVPSYNLAIAQFGWGLDLYMQSNVTFTGGTLISYGIPTILSDSDLGTTSGHILADQSAPNHISWTNVSRIHGSQIQYLLIGYEFWTFDSCTFWDCPTGVYGFDPSLTRGPTNGIINNCTFRDIDSVNYQDLDGHAVGCRDCCNWIVTGNTIISAASAIDFFADSGKASTNNVVAYNFIRDTHVHGGSGTGGSGAGITFEGGTTIGLEISNRIYGNIMFNIGTNGALNYEGPGIGNTLRDWAYIAGNTIANARIGISANSGSDPALGSIKDNIVYNPSYRYMVISGSSTTGVDMDYNLYYPAANSSDPGFVITPSTTHDTHSVFANPSFASATPTIASDFRLNTGSPGIGAGTAVGISTDFGGNAYANPPSIGAWELVHHTYRMTVGNLILGP